MKMISEQEDIWRWVKDQCHACPLPVAGQVQGRSGVKGQCCDIIIPIIQYDQGWDLGHGDLYYVSEGRMPSFCLIIDCSCQAEHSTLHKICKSSCPKPEPLSSIVSSFQQCNIIKHQTILKQAVLDAHDSLLNWPQLQVGPVPSIWCVFAHYPVIVMCFSLVCISMLSC